MLALTFMRGEPGYELLEIFLFLPPIPSCHRSTKGLQPVVVVSGFYVVSGDLDLGR